VDLLRHDPDRKYVTSTTSTGCDYGGNGDNILRLINPSGNANAAFGAVNGACAMIYVLDDDQEMGECCGYPLSLADMQYFSVKHDLSSNWIFGNNPDGNEVGAIAVVATAPNVALVPPAAPPAMVKIAWFRRAARATRDATPPVSQATRRQPPGICSVALSTIKP
jgi:hypothetical protein